MRIEGGRKEGGGGAACCWGLWWWLEKPFGCLELLCGSQLFELKLSTEGGRRRGSPSNILATQSARLSQQKSQRRRRRTWRQSEKERQRRWRRSSSRWGQQLLRAWRIVKVKKGSNLITTRIDTVFWQAIESAIEFIAHPSLSLCLCLPFYAPVSVPFDLFDGASIFLRALTESTKMNSINWLDQQEKLLADKCYKCHAHTTPTYLPTSLPHTHTASLPPTFIPYLDIFSSVQHFHWRPPVGRQSRPILSSTLLSLPLYARLSHTLLFTRSLLDCTWAVCYGQLYNYAALRPAYAFATPTPLCGLWRLVTAALWFLWLLYWNLSQNSSPPTAPFTAYFVLRGGGVRECSYYCPVISYHLICSATRLSSQICA